VPCDRSSSAGDAAGSPPEVPVKQSRLAILLSGRGSNFEAIARAVEDGRIADSAIVTVISDVPDAPGLERARARGLPAYAVDRRRFPNRAAHDAEVLRILEESTPDLVCRLLLEEKNLA